MSLDILFSWWEKFKIDPWEVEAWLFDSLAWAPNPPAVELNLHLLEGFRAQVLKEPGPYGVTATDAMDGFLATFLLPFIGKHQTQSVKTLTEAMRHRHLQLLAIETLSNYFAVASNPENSKSKPATPEELSLILNSLRAILSDSPKLSFQEVLTISALATDLNFQDVIEILWRDTTYLDAKDRKVLQAAFEGSGWLNEKGELFSERQPANMETYLKRIRKP